MKKIIRRCGRAISGALLCGSLLFGTASAEPAPATDGMAAFREVLSAPAAFDNLVFRQNVLFFAPEAKADLDMQGYLKGQTLRLLGDMKCSFTDGNGVATEMTVPFFVDLKKNEMTVYFRPDKKWRKLKMPPLPAAVADMSATPGEADNEMFLSMVKEVAVLRESDARRTMSIRLDSERVAELVTAFFKANPPAKGKPEDIAWQNNFMNCITEGLRRADIRYMWTVDKKDWRTVKMSCDLSSLVQETARVALETSTDWPGEAEGYIESVAYYSDMKAFTTVLAPEVRKRITLPEEAKQAVEVGDVTGEATEAKK